MKILPAGDSHNVSQRFLHSYSLLARETTGSEKLGETKVAE
jgi:hypothetical protein